MPDPCCSADYDAVFDDRTARRQLARYLRSGPNGTTAGLIEAIEAAGVRGATLLDVGGGVGVIGLELLAGGAQAVTDVDASRPYLSAFAAELERRGWSDRARLEHGDFVSLANDIEAADVVTLDRVVCCYGDWRALIDASVAKAQRLYGVIYPNDRWWLRAGIGLGNLVMLIIGRTFRGYVHPERAIDERIRRAGFAPRLHRRGLIWQTVLYERSTAAAARPG